MVARLRGAGCVFAEEEAELLVSAAPTPAELDAMVDRRAAGLPLEHVLGWSEFCGLRIAVDPGVLPAAPPQRAARARGGRGTGRDRSRAATVVVDLCCGSGALGAALAAALGPVELHAVDLDPAAVRCARRNVAAAGGRVYEGDLYAPLPAALRGRVDVLVANAPYVPSQEIGLLPAEARLHEPRATLDGGADGLDVVRRVIAAAPAWLAPGGRLVFETGEGQARRAAEAVARAGLVPRVASSGELEATVVAARRPSS